MAPSPVSFTRLAEDQIRRRLTEEEATFDEGTIARHPVMMAVEKARESKDDFAVIAGRPVCLNVYREWDGLDPAADVQRAKVPVLHLSFGKDRQVFPELTKSMTEKLAGVRLYTHSELPELDHFLVASRGTVGSYADPDRRVADEAVTTIVRWLLQK